MRNTRRVIQYSRVPHDLFFPVVNKSSAIGVNYNEFVACCKEADRLLQERKEIGNNERITDQPLDMNGCSVVR